VHARNGTGLIRLSSTPVAQHEFPEGNNKMMKANSIPSIDEYLRERLMPAEGVIPHIAGLDIFGNSIPAGPVGGDLFEYINFEQRYDVDSRIQLARHLSDQFLEPLPPGALARNPVDDHVHWLKRTPGYKPEMEGQYRFAKSSEQARIAEELQDLYSTAGVLVVDAQGHGIISAKIASTVHSTFHALMLSELCRYGKTTPELFENLNLRLALSVTARHELAINRGESAREIATMLYGEVRPGGRFRFVNFGHPPPLVFSAAYRRFAKLEESCMVQFLALGLQIPEDHPDRKKYYSMSVRQREIAPSDLSEITLMSSGDVLVLYTDGVFDGSDELVRGQLEAVMLENYRKPARDICNAILSFAVEQDDKLRQAGDQDLIDDKTVLVIKRN
jgi:serine phosphatase RsbU (regulator of sigma subunit)